MVTLLLIGADDRIIRCLASVNFRITNKYLHYSMSAVERVVLLIVLIAIIATVIYFLSKKKKPSGIPQPETIKNILQSHVLFYQQPG